jgi:fibronectin type 3 domain-containing protein
LVRVLWILLLLLFSLQISCREGKRASSTVVSSLTLTTSEVVDYNGSAVQVRFFGLTSSDYINLDILTVHTDNLCANPSMGSGTVNQFRTNGLMAQVPVNTPVDLYIRSQALNTCVLLQLSYAHPILLPTLPVFSSVVPLSPSRTTSSPGLFGTASPASSTVEFFSDSLCTVLLTTGSASQFSQVGIQVPLPLNQTTSIHALTRDPVGTTSGCVFMTDFTHTNTISPYPELLSMTPASPSNVTFAPNIRGTTAPGSLSVSLYSDSSCLNQIATGNPSDFENAGFNVTLTANTTNIIYAQSIDSMSNPSVCALFATYTHDDLPPANLSYLAATPISPTNQTLLPRISGLVSTDTDEVVFYNSALCVNTIGFGTRADFVGVGAVANVAANATTAIYARAFDSSDNGSDCTFLTNYTHNTIPPDPPTFVAMNPPSPNNLTITPLIQGLVEPRTTYLNFFKDEDCLLPIGQGTVNDYENAGIVISADPDATTAIYVQVRDFEGNVSSCTSHTSYAHSSVPAPDPAFMVTVPASPSRVSNSPAVLGTADPTISTVRIYSNPTCSTQLSSGTRGQYTSSGIVTNVPLNSTTTLYARAQDIYGNFSACVFLTTYIHNNIAPLTPTFTTTTPLSPNNVTSTPTIFGDVLINPASQLSPSRVDFYDGFSCSGIIGTGTPANYNSSGIVLDAFVNAETPVYAKSFDAAGNESACTFLTNYTYNNLIPAVPIFGSTNPGSPTYTRNVKLFGTYGPSSDFMARVNLGIYSNNTCTNLVTAATPTLFNTTGVDLLLNSNATMTLYGQTTNLVGTLSACQLLTTLTHYDLPVANLVANSNINGSVILTWNPDSFSSPTPRYTVERAVQSGGPYSVLSANQIGNSYNDLNVNNGVQYFYRLFASNSTGRSQYTSEVSITVSAPAPVASNNLTTSIGDSEVNLVWTGFPQNMTYRIFRSLQFAGPFTDLGITTTSTVYSDQSLTNGQTYFYFVKGVNAAGESAQSNIASAVPKAVPNIPTNFYLTPVLDDADCGGGGSARLYWTPSSYRSNYNVYRGNFKNNLNIISSPTLPYHNDCGTGGDNLLYYSVRASWDVSETNESNTVGFYSSSAPNLTLSPADGAINLSWNAPSTYSGYTSGDLRYTIYKSSDPDRNFTILQDNFVPRSYSDPTANSSGAYYYVQAYLIDVDSDRVFVGYPTQVRAAKAFTNPTAPTNLTLNYIESSASVQLSWISPDHFNNFRLYRATNPLGPFTLVQTVNTTFVASAPLVSGMNYFRIAAVWGAHETAVTNTVSFRNAAITGFNLVNQSDRINLSWNAIAGVQDYIVSRSNSINGPFTDYDVALTNSYSDLAVSINTGYYYKVRARFADFTQGQPVATALVGQITTSTEPSNISITVLGDTFVRAHWPRVTAATNYRVERAFNIAGPWTLAGNTVANSFTVFGLTPQTQYYFRVVAVVASVFYPSPAVVAYTFVPTTAPAGVVGNNQVAISWSAMAGAVDYNIERSTDGENFSTISTNYSMTSYTDLTATNGSIYFYRIITNYIPLSLTSPISVGFSPGRTPLSPTGLVAENNGTGSQVRLKWTEVSGRTSFNIYRSLTSGSYGAPIQSSSTALGTTVVGLTAGTTYYFRVTALNGTNESSPSNEISIIPNAEFAKPTAQFDTSSSILINWSAVPGANSYDVFRSRDGLNFDVIASNIVTTTYTDSTVTPSHTYYYRYQPFNAFGIEMSVSLTSDPVNISILPPTPIGLNLRAQTTNSVELYWSSVPSISLYEVLRSNTSGGPYTVVASPASNLTSYIDNTVSAGQDYFYRLRSVNSSGVRSNNSNEVAVRTVDGPLGLAAVNVPTGISSWNSLAGVTGYEVLRSLTSSGPYGLVGTTAALSLIDTNVVAAETYYYVVRGTYSSGLKSVQSSAVMVVRDGSLRLQVPIELTDIAISSSGTIDLAFDRTLTSFNSNDYDGVTSYELEVVATNLDASPRSVGIVNASNTLIDFVTVPANTTVPTLIKGTISMLSGSQRLRLELEQTQADNRLSVYSAKLLVNQTNATKTKLYYPLINSDELPSNVDQGVFAYSTSLNTYHDFSNASYFTRRATKLDKIENFNAWELETLVSTQGGAEGILALQNMNSSQLVPSTETRFTNSTLQLATIPFNEGALQFRAANENHNYALVIRCEYYCGSGSVRVYKAGLWVKLNHLTKTSVIYRTSGLRRNIASTTNLTQTRAQINKNLFTLPKVYFQIMTETDPVSQGTASGVYHSANSGSAGLNALSGSSVIVTPATVNLFRSSEIMTVPNDEKYMTLVTPSQGQITVRSSQILIETGP